MYVEYAEAARVKTQLKYIGHLTFAFFFPNYFAL